MEKKNKFFNPVWQNKGHIKAMKSITLDVSVYSIVAFNTRGTLKEINSKTPVMYIDQISDYIKNFKSNIFVSTTKLDNIEKQLIQKILQIKKKDISI